MITQHAIIVHEVDVKFVNPGTALARVLQASISKDLEALSFEGVTLGSDATVLSAGPNFKVTRTLCLNLDDKFDSLYNTPSLQEGRLKQAFVGSISQYACADCKITSFTLVPGACV